MTSTRTVRLVLSCCSRPSASPHATPAPLPTRLQAAVVSVPQEPATRPGSGPGMYASSYQTLARIHQGVAEARIALSLNHTAQVGAQVAKWSRRPCLKALVCGAAWPLAAGETLYHTCTSPSLGSPQPGCTSTPHPTGHGPPRRGGGPGGRPWLHGAAAPAPAGAPVPGRGAAAGGAAKRGGAGVQKGEARRFASWGHSKSSSRCNWCRAACSHGVFYARRAPCLWTSGSPAW